MLVDHLESNAITTLTLRSAVLQDQRDTFTVSHTRSTLITHAYTVTPLDSGHYPMPMGAGGGGYGHYGPPLPPPRGSRGGPRSVASSKGSSYSAAGPRMPYGGVPYGYPPNMYYGYPPGYAVSIII